jgi:hypothetical protein
MDPRYQQPPPPRSAGLQPQPSPRRGVDSGRGTMASASSGGSMTRAEKFEDEKRRIMETCFSKYDETGACKCAFGVGCGYRMARQRMEMCDRCSTILVACCDHCHSRQTLYDTTGTLMVYSTRTIHHPHPRHRRLLIPTNTAPTRLTIRQQRAQHHRGRAQYGSSTRPQSPRERQRLLQHRQDLGARRVVCRAVVAALPAAYSGGGDA